MSDSVFGPGEGFGFARLHPTGVQVFFSQYALPEPFYAYGLKGVVIKDEHCLKVWMYRHGGPSKEGSD